MEHTKLGPGPSSRKEKVVVDMSATDEDDKFVMETKDVWLTQVEMQSMIESVLQVFRDATMNGRTEESLEAEVVSLIENVNEKASKGEKTPVYRTIWKVIRLVVARDAVKEAIHRKVYNRSESKNLIQDLT